MVVKTDRHKIFTLPNILTYLRVLGVFLMVFFYFLPFDWSRYAAAAVFALAATTDWIDGYLARTYNMNSKLGELLDPVADKLLVSTALILMVYAYDHLLMVFIAIVIIGRELTVMAMRSWMAEDAGTMTPPNIKVSWLGKAKTLMQLLGIACFFAFPPGGDNPFLPYNPYLPLIALVVLLVASVLTLWSAYYYGLALLRQITK